MYSLVLMAALSGSATAPATWGCHGCHGCYGCYGCYSSCGCYSYGCYSYGCGGCYRSCGWSGCGCYSYGGCYGCSSPYAGCYGGCYGCCGGIVRPMPAGGVGAPPAGGPMPPAGGPVKKEDEANARTAPAYLVVNLPADAKLMIDNEATTTTSASRRFVSPALERGKEFVYNLKAELMRDGTPVTTTKQVTVRAGETTQVTLEFAPATALK